MPLEQMVDVGGFPNYTTHNSLIGDRKVIASTEVVPENFESCPLGCVERKGQTKPEAISVFPGERNGFYLNQTLS